METELITDTWLAVVLAMVAINITSLWAALNQAYQQKCIEIEKHGIWIVFLFSIGFLAIVLITLAIEKGGLGKLATFVFPAFSSGWVFILVSIWSMAGGHGERFKMVYWPTVLITLSIGVVLQFLAPMLNKSVIYFAFSWFIVVCVIQMAVHLRRFIARG